MRRAPFPKRSRQGDAAYVLLRGPERSDAVSGRQGREEVGQVLALVGLGEPCDLRQTGAELEPGRPLTGCDVDRSAQRPVGGRSVAGPEEELAVESEQLRLEVALAV